MNKAALRWASLGAAAAVVGGRYVFTDLFGFGFNPLVLDALACSAVLLLCVFAYRGTGRDKITLLLFSPLLLVASVPVLLFAAAFCAARIYGFAP